MVSKDLIFRFLIDFIYPNRCPVCRKVIRWDKLICRECEQSLVYNSENFTTGIHNADYEYSPLLFDGNVKNAVYSLKHSPSAENFAELCSEKIVEKLCNDSVLEKTDWICAVPMHKSKRSKRGYNQSETVAEFISKKTGKPTDFTQLLRTADTMEQHHLTAKERLVHAEKIYMSNPKHKDISGKSVLLCDDVITTGSSMDICAALLKKQGAAEVFCVSCAVTPPKNNMPQTGE